MSSQRVTRSVARDRSPSYAEMLRRPRSIAIPGRYASGVTSVIPTSSEAAEDRVLVGSVSQDLPTPVNQDDEFRQEFEEQEDVSSVNVTPEVQRPMPPRKRQKSTPKKKRASKFPKQKPARRVNLSSSQPPQEAPQSPQEEPVARFTRDAVEEEWLEVILNEDIPALQRIVEHGNGLALFNQISEFAKDGLRVPGSVMCFMLQLQFDLQSAGAQDDESSVATPLENHPPAFGDEGFRPGMEPDPQLFDIIDTLDPLQQRRYVQLSRKVFRDLSPREQIFFNLYQRQTFVDVVHPEDSWAAARAPVLPRPGSPTFASRILQSETVHPPVIAPAPAGIPFGPARASSDPGPGEDMFTDMQRCEQIIQDAQAKLLRLQGKPESEIQLLTPKAVVAMCLMDEDGKQLNYECERQKALIRKEKTAFLRRIATLVFARRWVDTALNLQPDVIFQMIFASAVVQEFLERSCFAGPSTGSYSSNGRLRELPVCLSKTLWAHFVGFDALSADTLGLRHFILTPSDLEHFSGVNYAIVNFVDLCVLVLGPETRDLWEIPIRALLDIWRQKDYLINTPLFFVEVFDNALCQFWTAARREYYASYPPDTPQKLQDFSNLQWGWLWASLFERINPTQTAVIAFRTVPPHGKSPEQRMQALLRSGSKSSSATPGSAATSGAASSSSSSHPASASRSSYTAKANPPTAGPSTSRSTPGSSSSRAGAEGKSSGTSLKSRQVCLKKLASQLRLPDNPGYCTKTGCQYWHDYYKLPRDAILQSIRDNTDPFFSQTKVKADLEKLFLASPHGRSS